MTLRPRRPRGASPARQRRRPRRGGSLSRHLRRLAIGVTGAICALVLGAGAASADSWSPYIAPQQWPGYFGNCTITSGPVLDPYTSSHGFAAIGGGQLACSMTHTYQIRTQEYFSSTGVGSSYYLVANSSLYSATNRGFSGILETSRVCGTGYWFTRVTVSVAGYSPLYFDSYAHYVSAAGYSGSTC
jgi:hypothetical protein